MKNWLGQEIKVGDVVYRGARDGNSSSYKIGVVQKVGTDVARVKWIAAAGSRWVGHRTNDKGSITVPRRVDSSGSPSIDSLVVLDRSVLDGVESVLDRLADIPPTAFADITLQEMNALLNN